MSVTAPSPAPSPGRRTAPPELSVTSLTVRFGALTALSDVSLTVRAGECVAIAGENGAGKTTLIRAVGGDIAPDAGTIELDGRPITPDPSAAARLGVRIVWQDLALADNLDTGANIMLGNERHGHLLSPVHLHTDAARILDRLGIPIHDTTRPVKSLSSGQRQMVAVARAMARAPRILLLDEPTSSLGIRESALVETLITRLRQQGTTILLACHDITQMFRLADRIAVLRHGRLVAEVSPSEVHPDDVAALISGQEVDSSARRQLTRLHRLAGRLVTSDPSSSLSVILSAFGAAIGSERLCIHLLTLGSLSPEGGTAPELHCAASLGVPETLLRAWERLPADADGGPAGLAAASQQPVIEDNIPARPGSWSAFGGLARSAKVASSWSVPVLGPGGLLGVITVFRSTTGKPRRDDLDLASLYAGQAANAVERDRLLEEVTARNQVLETMREMLQTLAGPVPAADGLNSALQSLRGGLRADETALVTADPADPADPDGSVTCRAYSGLRKETPAATLALARAAIDHAAIDRAATDRTDTDRTDTDRTATDCTATDRTATASDGGKCLTVTFGAPGGQTALLARWDTDVPADDATDLMEDAARSLRLALEREEALAAQQETMALRRSRDMQHAFLRRLSHELRTPLTAITGYATSLLQPDVTWDAGTRHRFLTRIAAESARLGRLVNDLLDFSAIESGVFRLACDWCDLPLVIDAAVAVLPPDTTPRVEVRPGPGLPAIWADHDRLEQVFVNLIGNALVHNPPGTRVQVTVEAPGPHRHRDRHGDGERATDTETGPDTGPVVVTVADDGTGIPPGTLGESPGPGRSRGLRPGAGLGLSIAQGIVEAHGGSMELVPAPKGTRFRITLPVEETEAT